MAEDNLNRGIYASLSERVLELQYPPGHRLTEEALCAEFGVSRSPVREALGMLVENGLVDKKARQGYTVRRLDLREIEELYDVRLVLEVAVLERVCAKGMDTADLERLEQFWRELYERLPAMAEHLADSDEAFHATLAHAAGNGVLEQLLRFVDRRIHFVRLVDITSPERLRVTCLDHLAILAAIRERNVARGLEALRRNIEWGRRNVETALKEALIRAYRVR
jgi:DNA-binding GntR family transcriptional regulator